MDEELRPVFKMGSIMLLGVLALQTLAIIMMVTFMGFEMGGNAEKLNNIHGDIERLREFWDIDSRNFKVSIERLEEKCDAED